MTTRIRVAFMQSVPVGLGGRFVDFLEFDDGPQHDVSERGLVMFEDGNRQVIVPFANIRYIQMLQSPGVVEVQKYEVVERREGAGAVGGGGRIRSASGRFVAKGGKEPTPALGNP